MNKMRQKAKKELSESLSVTFMTPRPKIGRVWQKLGWKLKPRIK
jgi:hypothetical protein